MRNDEKKSFGEPRYRHKMRNGKKEYAIDKERNSSKCAHPQYFLKKQRARDIC